MAKKEQSEKILEQTKSTFNAVGIIKGMGRDNAYSERELDKGKMEGHSIRNLRFYLQTSKNQQIQVEMSGFEPDNVYLYNFQKKETLKVTFDEWLNNQEQYQADGYNSLDTEVKLEDTKESGVRDVAFMNTELVYENFHDGDAVFISGDVERSRYEKDGKQNESVRYRVKRIYKRDEEPDFDAPNFKEYAVFKEQFVFESAEDNEDEKSITIFGKTIDYHEKTFPIQIVLSWDAKEVLEHPNASKMTKEEQAEEKKAIKKIVEINEATAEAFKEIEFGTLLIVQGNIIRKAETEEIEEENVSPLLTKLQGRATSKITNYTNKLLFVGTKEVEEGKYTEDDFINALEKTNLVEEEKPKAKKSPLAGRVVEEVEEAPFDIEEDDLPF